MSLSPQDRNRRALIAVVLAGLAPPGGHLFVGRPLRGFTLLLLSFGAGLAWIMVIPRSLHRAQAFGLAGALLVLALIIDAGVLARRSPAELPPRPWHRWWVYLLLALLSQLVIPDLMFSFLERRAGLVLQPDRAMEPSVLEGERIVFERLPPERLTERGTLVVIEDAEGALLVRRVAGQPGETIELRGGVVLVEGREWLDDRFRLNRRGELDLAALRVGEREVLVLGDRRRTADPHQGLVPLDRLRGQASWVLQPPGFPRDLQFGVRLGESLR